MDIKEIVDVILEILFYNWMIVRICFFFVPTLLVIFSFSMVVLTLGLWCKYKEKIQYKYILRFLLICYVILTSAYALGLIQQTSKIATLSLSIMEIFTIIVGILAPICILIVGRLLLRLKIKGISVFNPIILWIIYLILCCIWEILYPEEIFLLIAVLFVCVNIVLVHYVMSKGGELNE